MFIKKFDILSPYITLYFKGEKKHSSKFSGILSIITYLLVLIISIYYIVEFVNKKSPKAYFFNRYVEDAGDFTLNSSSMFNFIQICDVSTNEPIPFDYSKIRAIGSDEILYDDYMNAPDIILNKNHWLYGYCNNNSDTEGIGYLIDFKNFDKSSCIKKYYDKNSKKYYNIGEKEFRWPILEKGCSHPNRTYYGIILQRCDKIPDPIKSQDIKCSSEQEITEYINKISLNFEIIDHYPDILNYKTPLTKYFYTVTSAITNGVYIINHLNFNPANILTHNGIFFDNIVQEHSYIFVQNEKHTIDSSSLAQNQTTNGCLIGIYFWMQNTLQYYERVYSRLQDSLSDIGGIYSIVESIAYILNLLVHNFIIVLDTEDLVINRDNKNFNERDRIQRPTILRKVNKIMNPPKRNYLVNKKRFENNEQDEQFSSNYQRFIRKGPDIMQNIYNIKKENINNILVDNLYQKNNINNNNSNKYEQNQENNNYYKNINIYNIRNKNYEKNVKFNEGTNRIIGKKILSLKNDESIKEKNDEDNSPIVKQNFTWIKDIWYLLHCGNNNNKIAYYENFRAKLISEENIIQSYLDVYKLNKLYQ